MAEIKKTTTVKPAEKAEPVKVTAEVKPAAAVQTVEKKAEVKTETKAEAKAEVPAKKAVKTTAKKTTVKKTAAPKKTTAKAATEKAAVKRTVKKEAKQIINLQFAGKSYSIEDLQKIANDVWKFDLHKADEEYTSLELYVKPEESVAYYVFNGDVTGSFFI